MAIDLLQLYAELRKYNCKNLFVWIFESIRQHGSECCSDTERWASCWSHLLWMCGWILSLSILQRLREETGLSDCLREFIPIFKSVEAGQYRSHLQWAEKTLSTIILKFCAVWNGSYLIWKIWACSMSLCTVGVWSNFCWAIEPILHSFFTKTGNIVSSLK